MRFKVGGKGVTEWRYPTEITEMAKVKFGHDLLAKELSQTEDPSPHGRPQVGGPVGEGGEDWVIRVGGKVVPHFFKRILIALCVIVIVIVIGIAIKVNN